TPPMSRKTLALVPGKAAAVFGFGLNPADAAAPAPANGKAAALKSVTGLDIFREVFGNIQEITAYVAPMEGGGFGTSENNDKPYIPNGAVIIAARDAAKSRALWTQLLSLPSIIMGEKVAPPKDVEIGGQQATVFSVPNFGPVYVAQVKDCLVVSPRKA